MRIRTMIKLLALITVSLFVGAYGMRTYYDIKFLDCHDFTTKHTFWKGYIAQDQDGNVRCFWLEQAYPNRIRQGVPI